MKIHNFYAGPAILPEIVKKKASKAALNYKNKGLSLMEMSHRGAEVVSIMETAESLVRELLGVSDKYAVLFLTGGASSQFFMSAMNLFSKKDKVAYLNTGTWSTKAIKEAKEYCDLYEVASSKDKNFNYVPRNYKLKPKTKYLHITSNNTIFGTQIKQPKSKALMIADMSSDIFSRPLKVDDYGLIYAGAQKNVGLAGVTLVIVRKNLLGKVRRHIPTMLDYRTHIAKGSAFNTPPVFSIYTTMLNLQWIKSKGGVKAMVKRNKEKASLLYNEIDSNPLFVGTVAKRDRSLMNVTFLLKDEKLNKKFMSKCKKAGIVGIKGHRSVGGFRASMYNGMELRSVRAGEFIRVYGQDFQILIFEEKRKGLTGKLAKGNYVEIKVPIGADETAKNQAISKLLSRIFSSYFLKDVTERVQYYNRTYYHEEIETVRLKNNQSNWGSCSTKRNINLSSRLLFAPTDVLDYVIVHELAHLKEMNHSPRFWKIVKDVMPDYEEKEKWLSKYGETLKY